jgi:uncharacterized delta-60 repeat protein
MRGAGRRPRLTLLTSLCCLLLSGVGHAIAAPGDLDGSFADNGILDVASAAPAQSGAFEIAIGPNGSIFVLGREQCGSSHCGRELVVSRFRSDGTLDGSYGAEGVATAFPGLQDVLGVPHIAVDSRGRAIVVAQQAGDLVVTRLDPHGDPESAFGGVRRLDTGSRSAATPLSLAVASDDSIMVAASWSEPRVVPGSESPTGLLLAHLLADGTLDPEFGSSGSVTLSVPAPSSFFEAFGLERDGSVIAAGNTCCPPGPPTGAPTEPVLLRVEAGGRSPDPEFGSRIWGGDLGSLLGAPGGYSVSVKGLFLRRNGRLDLVLTAEEATEARRFSYLLRVHPGGRLDKRFGDRGVRDLPKPVDAAAVDSEGRIFAVTRSEGPHSALSLHAFRLTAGGGLDRTFGGGWDQLRRPGSGGAEVAAFAGQRPVFFEQGSPECRPGECQADPFLMRLRGGTSFVRCLGQEATIVGTGRADVIRGTRHRDVIAALGGNDTVRGRGGDDLICGGAGRDRLIGGPGRDRFSAGEGDLVRP